MSNFIGKSQFSGRPFPQDSQKLCYKVYTHDVHVYRCIETIIEYSIPLGIQVVHKGQNANDSYKTNWIDRLLVPFAEHVIRDCMCYGFAGWNFEKDDKTGTMYPKVCPAHRIRLQRDLDGEVTGWEINENYTGTTYIFGKNQVEHLFFLEEPNWVANHVCSPTWRVTQLVVLQNRLMAYAEVNDRKAAITPLLLKTRPSKINENWVMDTSLGGLDGGAAARQLFPGSQNGIVSVPESFVQGQSDVVEKYRSNINKARQAAARQFNTIGPAETVLNNLYEDQDNQASGAHGDVPRMVIAEDMEPVSYSYPQTRSDFIHFLSTSGKRICASFGVPYELVQSDVISKNRRHGGGDFDNMSQKQMETICNRIQTWLNPILLEAYLMATKNDRAAEDIMDGKESDMSNHGYEVSIIKRFTKLDQLVNLYNVNLIPLSVMKDYISKEYNFDINAYENDVVEAPEVVNEQDVESEADLSALGKKRRRKLKKSKLKSKKTPKHGRDTDGRGRRRSRRNDRNTSSSQTDSGS